MTEREHVSPCASSTATAGYADPRYARAFSEFGSPCLLEQSGGWILKREIDGSADSDAMGLYPLFTCRNWPLLPEDLTKAGETLVSIALVTDPFGDYTADQLQAWFGDVVLAFKEHFVVDLSHPGSFQPHGRHRAHVRRAVQQVTVEEVRDPSHALNDWTSLYSILTERHSIRGIAAFSRYSFEQQLQVPGLTAFRALHKGNTVGMTLWLRRDEIAYYHLGAYSQAGYDLHASYAIFAHAISHFRNAGLRWLNLGAGAGLHAGGTGGLSQFKRGWATGTRTAFFCGRIFDRQRYRELTEAAGMASSSYFPAYRSGDVA